MKSFSYSQKIQKYHNIVELMIYLPMMHNVSRSSSSLTQLSSITKRVSFTVYSIYKVTLCSLLGVSGQDELVASDLLESLLGILQRNQFFVSCYFFILKSFIIALYVQDKMNLAGIFTFGQDKIIIRCLLSRRENGIESF